MTEFSRNTSLDHRLQRLTVRQTDRERDQDIESGLESMQPPETAATTRVLVLIATATVPAIVLEYSPAKITERIYTLDIPVHELDALAADPSVVFVEAGRRLLPSLTTSVAATRADAVRQPPLALEGTGVVVGIIDYFFDYTLADFRDADGKTRVAYLWDQTLDREGAEHAPEDFRYGVEYDAAAIDAALAEANPFARVRHRPKKGSHGTHVAGTAAGNGRSCDAAFPTDRWIGVAPNATILFVHPGGVGLTDSVRVADAIAYIYKRARDLGMPCVINLSLGQNGGSHDAESLVERAIDVMTEEPGRVFVCAAGNEHIWAGHASGTLAQGGSRALRVHVGKRDHTTNEIEIWYSSRDQLTLTVRTPDGESVGPIAPGPSTVVKTQAGNRIFISHDRFMPLNGDALVYIEISPDTAETVVPGDWELELHGVDIKLGRFDAYIERDLRDETNHYSDQASFVADDFDGFQTLGTPATTRRGIAVANYDHVNNEPHASSSRGPTRDGRPKPEIAAPGTDIVASCARGGHEGIPVRIPMTGTSMAAPHVTGIVALMLQKRPTLTAEQVSAILVASASPLSEIGPAFDPGWGHGRVDALAAVNAVPES
ncbi:MAG: S8 family peptidase [Kofleriaceae bacterium]